VGESQQSYVSSRVGNLPGDQQSGTAIGKTDWYRKRPQIPGACNGNIEHALGLGVGAVAPRFK
jgi:hypothetical protein